MVTRYQLAAGLLIGLVLTAAAVLRAQEPRVATGRSGSTPLAVPEPENPRIQAVLDSNPSTPIEWVRAAKALAGIQEPGRAEAVELAKGFLKNVRDARLNRKQLADLAAQLGSGTFIELGSDKDLAPEAGQVKDAVLQAAEQELKDPGRLAGLVDQLNAPSPQVRYRAMEGLRRAGSASVGPMLKVLADPAQAAKHPNVRAALVVLGQDAVAPLEAALESSDPKLKTQVIGVLGQLKVGSSALHILPWAVSDPEQGEPEVRTAAQDVCTKLVGRIPDKPEAVRTLRKQTQAYVARKEPLKTDEEGRVDLWTWDEANQQPVADRYTVDDASRLLASRYARHAYSVAPEDPEVQDLHLETLLEQAQHEAGLDTPLPGGEGTPADYAAKFGPEVIEQVLDLSMDRGQIGSATAAARTLGRIGTAEELLNQGSEPTVLVRATRYGDRRVRYAAVEAILNLKPAKPFPGSSYVTEALAYFASSRGAPRALVACRTTEEAQRVGGYLAEMGYELDTATTGRDAIRQALASPDYELALVEAGLEYPPPNLLIQQLRHDCRTAGLPVGILARDGQLPRAEVMAGPDRLTQVFVRPHTAESVRWEVEELASLAGPAAVPQAERLSQASQALQWIVDLNQSPEPQTLFDLGRTEPAALGALYVPELGEKATEVLAERGTAESQTALVDLASRWTQPLALRQAATKAFRRNTQEHGILLTRRQILAQYDRYNNSETLDRPTQQILGFLLDCIEARTRPAGQPPGTVADNAPKD